MNKLLSVAIPTKVYLKKYVQFKLGEDFFIRGPHHIQKFLINLLDKKIYNYNFTALNTQYTDRLPVFLNHYTFSHIGFGISSDKVIEFNNFLEELFDEELYLFCQNYLLSYKVAGSAITAFASENGIHLKDWQKKAFTKEPKLEDARDEFAKKIGLDIPGDVSFEGLKKMEYRARKRREKLKNILLEPVPELSNAGLTLLF